MTYTIDGIAGAHNWYQGSSGGNYIVVHWTAYDPDPPGVISSSGCEPAIQIPGPNTGTTKTCSATSDGGTTTVTTKTLKIDATAPTNLQANAERATDHNGWYNHAVGIAWGGTDATSGIDTCTALTYSGPDVANGSRSGTCTDMAGNTSAALAFSLSYDATRPTASSVTPARGTDHNGWYNHALGITWAGSDAMSGIDSCTSRTYTGPDVSNGSTSGTCTDKAGNTSTALNFGLSYDATRPAATTATPSRTPDRNGWYNHDVGITWSGSDATSGIDSCTSRTYGGPDVSNGSTSGTCTDEAGNTSTALAFGISFDEHAPAVTVTAARNPDQNGWYNHSVGITWRGTDAISGIDTCTSLMYDGPDVANGSTRGTCTDKAGNTAPSVSFGLSYDATRPTASSVTPARGTDHNGWYNHALGITWAGSDAMSGIDSCTSRNYTGPDVANGSTSGTCIDRAGNTSTALSFPLSYDHTAPVVTVAAGRNPDHNGWYNHDVGITWSGTDPTSGIDSCTSRTYSGPDVANGSTSGTCTDIAGNTAPALPFQLSYDETRPSVTAANPGRAPDHNGWYNHAVGITWSGTDATSGIDSCTSLTYSGPDVADGSTSGTCTDRAGNPSATSLSLPFSYDATRPSVTTAIPARQPDHNGWYNNPLRIDWHGTDATSGIESCTSRVYSAPDDANGSTSGTCTDLAGNTSATPLSFALSYDGTDPVVSVTAARSPDHNGWYTHPVGISWSGTDATSGIASCSPPVNYAGPDRSDARSFGFCTDHAGNSASPPPLAFKYDATAPVTLAVPSRKPDANGWYNRAFRIDWKGSDPISGVAACTSQAYGGPDTAGVSRSGVCSDKAGNTSAPVAFDFRYDHTPPSGLVVAAARPPDHDGWYNRPLAIRWSASDALAGIASCTSLTYTGPDTSSTDLTGACTDRAGNVAGPLRFALSYDATPPAFKGLIFKAMDDRVALRWRLTGAKALQIMRSPGVSKSAASALYEGAGSRFTDRRVENYVKYRYTLIAEDAAGNTVKRTVFAKPMPVLFAPRPDAHVRPHSSVVFAWKPAPRARYFNLQLWLKGHAVGSWWPPKPRLKLSSRWHFRGATHRLEPGTYTWYVWPGRGPRRLGKYGQLLGKSTFVVG